MNYKNFDEMYKSMNLDEFVDWINENHMDIFSSKFPLIYPMNDSDTWDRIAEKIGALELMKAAKWINMNAPYFAFDESSNDINIFSNKSQLIAAFEKEQLEETFNELN